MLELAPQVADVFAGDSATVDEYLAQIQEMTILTAIQVRRGGGMYIIDLQHACTRPAIVHVGSWQRACLGAARCWLATMSPTVACLFAPPPFHVSAGGAAGQHPVV